MRRELTCDEFVEGLTDFLEQALGPAQTMSFKSHLSTCVGCRDELQIARQTIALTAGLGDTSVSDETAQSLLTLFREWAVERRQRRLD